MATRSLGQLTLDLVAKIGGFTGPLDQAQRASRQRMKQIERDAKEASAGFAKMTAAAGAAGAGVVALTLSAAQSTRELKNQASLANSSTQEFQRWSYASSTVGISQEKLADILKDTNDRVGEFLSTGGGQMKDFFTNIAPKVGVTAQQFRNLSGPQALQLYYDSLQKAGLGQEDMTFYMEAMADETTALIPLLSDGGKAFGELGDQADDLGIILSNTQTEALTNFANDADRVKSVMSATAKVVAAELAPAMSDLADEMIGVYQAFQEGEYDTQLDVITRIATVVGGAAGAYAAYRGALATATIAQWAFNAAAAANPIGALVLVLGGTVGALYAFREELGWTEDKAKDAARQIDLLTGDIKDLTAAQLENKKVPLVAGLIEAQVKAARLSDEIERVQQKAKQQDVMYQGRPGAARAQLGLYGGDGLNTQLEEQQGKIKASQEALDKLDRAIAAFGSSTGRGGRGVWEDQSEADKALKDAISSYESLRSKFDEVGAAEAEFAKQTKELDLLLAAGKITQDQYGDATAYLREELAQTQQTATGMSSELQGLLDKLDPVSASSRQYAADLALLTRNGELTAETMERLKEAYQSTQTASEAYGQGFGAEIGSRGGIGAPTDPEQQDEWQTWLESARDAFTDFDNLNRQVAEDFTSRFGDAIEGVVFDYENLGDAAQGVAEGMARSVVNALGQMAAQWLAYQVVQMTVGRTTQATAGMQMAANAQAQSVMAGLNAFTSTAAIPIIGPELAPVAASTAVAATQPMAATVGTLALSGMAHDGIDAVPADGSWFLKKGERVTTSETSAKLDHTLDNIESRMADPGQQGSAMMGSPTIHVDARGASDPAAVRRAAEQGAEMGYRRVFEDVRTNGPIRRKLGV